MVAFQAACVDRVRRATRLEGFRKKVRMKPICLFIAAIGAWSLISAAAIAQDKGLQSGLMRASKVAGMDVRNPANENLGDIQDIVLEQETGSIAYAALSFGGFLGMGDKLFAVPWGALKPTTDGKAFTLDIPKERLQKAPGFDKKNWPDLNNHQWAVDIHTYYSVKPYWEARGGVLVSDAGVALRGVLLRSSKVIGMDVRNPGRDKLGNIQDVVVDQPTGVVAYGVLSFGGFLGLGDKLFAIPWAAPKMTEDHSAFTLDLPKDRLQKAPGFDKNVWPDLNNRKWGTELHTYYGVTPYWEVRGGGVVTAMAEGVLPEIRVYTGKIKTFTKQDPAIVVLKTDVAEIRAELAPMSFLEDNRLLFNAADDLTFKAYEITRDGQKVLLVTEVTTKDKRIVKFRNDDATPVWAK
jgi:sporulation protein YlmC with PRC-barrel domain